MPGSASETRLSAQFQEGISRSTAGVELWESTTDMEPVPRGVKERAGSKHTSCARWKMKKFHVPD